MPEIPSAAINELLGFVDDALATADEAVKRAAELEAAAAAPAVTLIKVASSTYTRVAERVAKTGVLGEKTAGEIADILKAAGEAGCLEILEKMASRAVFAFEPEADSFGSLVRKTVNDNPGIHEGLSKTAAIYREAANEYDREHRG